MVSSCVRGNVSVSDNVSGCDRRYVVTDSSTSMMSYNWQVVIVCIEVRLYEGVLVISGCDPPSPAGSVGSEKGNGAKACF